MLAASFWSLLAPAIELAETSGAYGSVLYLSIRPLTFRKASTHFFRLPLGFCLVALSYISLSDLSLLTYVVFSSTFLNL